MMIRGAAALFALTLAACRHGTPSAPDVEDAGAPADLDAEVADLGSPDVTRLPPSAQGWWRDRVFYEVFVRSFQDSDGDGIGDLRGLTARLDELNDGNPATDTDLGITGLWLMPIHPSPSYHGYDVTDYRAVNPQYGTLADLDALLAAAHARGIKVVIDFVLNHSSRAHPWFLDASTGGARRDWYLWRSDDPGWRQPWGPGPVWHPLGGQYYYGIFWSGMPDLNLGNASVEQEMLDTLRFWLDRGMDGFRVDAARHLFESARGELSDQPESHALIRRLRRALAATHPDALLIAEAWTGMATVAQYYGQDDEFQLAFGFDTAAALKAAAKDGLRVNLLQNLAEGERVYADRGFEAPFLANHDMQRVMRELAQDAGAMRVAAAALFGLPGTPFLYYGEEIGMVGGATPADEDKRTPMRWTSAAPGHGFTSGTPWRTAPEGAGVDVESQQGEPTSLWRLFRALIALRQQSPALARGVATRPAVSGAGKGVAVWLREHAGARVLCVLNFAADPSPAFAVTVPGAPRVLLAEGLSQGPGGAAGQLQFPGLAGRGFAFLQLE